MSYRITNKDTLGSLPKVDKQLILSLDERRLYADIQTGDSVRRYELFDPDCTAFDVYPHTTDIPVGNNEDLGGYVTQEVPANTTHLMVIRTLQLDPSKSDVVVDWGDGAHSAISLGEFNTSGNVDASADEAAGERNYTLEHDYAPALTAAGVTAHKYTVRVYGRQYYNIMHHCAPAVPSAYVFSNLICRALSEDLPIASHVGNLTAFCEQAQLLIHVDANAHKYRWFEKADQLFRNCKNLLSVTGFGRSFTKSYCAQTFYGCTNLQSSDAQLPMDAAFLAASSKMYAECPSLSADISTLVPEVSGSAGPFSLTDTFKGCSNLQGIVPAAKLWDSQSVTWTSTANCFTGCSDAIRAQVPVSWGGTAPDSIIKKSYDERLTELEEVAEILATI